MVVSLYHLVRILFFDIPLLYYIVILTLSRERRGVFYHRIPGTDMANLPELIFPRRNSAVGMKLCIYNKYHKNFLFLSKTLHGCVDVSIFSAYVSKNWHSSSF